MSEIQEEQIGTNSSKPLTNLTCQNAKTLENNTNKPSKKITSKTNRNEVSANWNSLASTIRSQKPKSPSKKIGKLNCIMKI